jgi:hypothetical protein
MPYQATCPCDYLRWPDEPYWKYSVTTEGTWVEILSNLPPPAPPDLGIHVELGNVRALPGERIEMPIRARHNDELL